MLKNFVHFYLEDIAYRYYRDDENDKDVFEMDFLGKTQVAVTSKLNAKDAAKAMASYDFNEYISSYVWQSPPFERNQFYETNFVKFLSKDGKRGGPFKKEGKRGGPL